VGRRRIEEGKDFFFEKKEAKNFWMFGLAQSGEVAGAGGLKRRGATASH
jgi:hypothetical protein